jgi:superoxide dismutase, Fe-Mn family
MPARRDGLKLALAAAAVAAGMRPDLVLPARGAGPVFKVPPLGYSFDALERHIDTTTVMIHHDRHHGAYVAPLNGLVEKHPHLAAETPLAILADLSKVTEPVHAQVRNNLSRHSDDSFCWVLTTPGGGKDPSGDPKYQNKRANSLAAWWNTVRAAANFAKAPT